MIKISNKSIIYIACPYNSISGGAETLHQLAGKLTVYGFETFIYYFDVDKIEEVNEKFKKYNVKYTFSIEDKKSNVIIIPESFTYLIYKYKHIQKCIWWLSLDFYFKSSYKCQIDDMIIRHKIPKYLAGIFRVISYLYIIFIKKSHKLLSFKNYNNKYYHLFNCEYVKEFLTNNGVDEEHMFYLCGPIRKDFILTDKSIIKKENIVAYNPAKGFEYTLKIINKFRSSHDDIKFIPIKNMTPDDIKILLQRAKVYIDFGFFPGPERIPREAVACYCNIITSNLGSAKNDIDVPIPSKYKFSPRDENLDIIYNEIKNMIYNYERYIDEYELYREKVIDQIELFDKNIQFIFEKIEN